MKISYTIAAYFGKRNVKHPNCLENPIWYVSQQINYINKQSVFIERIYIICTFDKETDNKYIIDQLNEYYSSDKRIVIKVKENDGASYTSWKFALHEDNGYSDYVILMEDDYMLYSEDSVELLLEYFEKDSNLFYLCQFWNTNPYIQNGLNIVAHAAMSNGVINNKMYHDLRINRNMDFKVKYGTGYDVYCSNQATFLDDYNISGCLFKDIREKYSVYFPHSDIEYGKADGKKLIVPIDRDLGYF